MRVAGIATAEDGAGFGSVDDGADLDVCGLPELEGASGIKRHGLRRDPGMVPGSMAKTFPDLEGTA